MATIAISGGHLTPALATLEELISRGHKIIYINEKGGAFEDATRIMESLGVKVEKITTAKWHRHSLSEAWISLGKMPSAIKECWKILKSENVDLVLSFGGYQSVPLVIAAKLLKIKAITHEQTLTPGLANQFNARLVDKVAVTNEIPAKFFPKRKTVITGNPIRQSILIKHEKNSNLKRKYLYFAGCHLGSKVLNQ